MPGLMSEGPSKRTFALRLRVPNILTAIHLSNRDRGMRIRLCCLLFLTDQERYNIFFNRLGSLALYGLQRQNSYGQTLAEAERCEKRI